MTERKPKLQYAMDVTVWHDASFGHRVTLTQQTQGKMPERVQSWDWKGLGMDPALVKEIQAWVSAVIADHLIYRYGIADQLDLKWAGDPDPF